VNDIVPIRLKDNKVSKIVLEHREDSGLAPFGFYAVASPNEVTLSLFKKREENAEYVCLVSSLVAPKKAQLIPEERTEFLRAKIVLDHNIILEKDAEETFGIKADSLHFIFDRGKTKILWDQKELTQGLSWDQFDSYQAISRLGSGQ
jgi:hypothetical protein